MDKVDLLPDGFPDLFCQSLSMRCHSGEQARFAKGKFTSKMGEVQHGCLKGRLEDVEGSRPSCLAHEVVCGVLP